MKLINKVLMPFIATIGFSATASADVITLDFDSIGTGSDIIASPLSTSAGTITASAEGGSLLYGSGGGFTGHGLRHDQNSDSDYAQLAFDFDVSSVSFLYAGFLSGAFTAEVLDSTFTVLDTFTDLDTDDDTPGGPITLSGSDIRYFRFSDSPSTGLSFSGVDDLVITTDAIDVPEPGTLALLGLGLVGLGLNRKKKA